MLFYNENNMVGSFCNLRLIGIVLLYTSTLYYINCDAFNDEFTEELFIKPLPTGHIYSHFHFLTKWNVTAESHFHLFPKSLGEILFKHEVRELYFSLTLGRWRYQSWGYPIMDSGPGLELWVWFQETAYNLDDHYLELTNALSGLFCASLNFIDSTNTASPKVSFRPRGVSSKNYFKNSSYLRYSVLPRETVCTENLTPWKKLLPCNTKAGLATLLNANQIFNSNYHSFTVNIRPVCKNSLCVESSLELSQTLSLVSDTYHINKDKRDWSQSKLYGRLLTSYCPLAKSSKVYVDITSKTYENFILSPDPSLTIVSLKGDENYTYAAYDIKQHLLESEKKLLNVAIRYEEKVSQTIITSPTVHAVRSVTGYGQEFGGLSCTIYNTDWAKPVTIVYLEMIPWFLRTYLHSLKISNGHQDLKPLFQNYVPAQDRKRPSLLELVLSIPPNSEAKISLQFEQTLLKWTEYPPDANHGFYVGSAVISAILPSPKNFTGIPQEGSTIYDGLTLHTSQHFIRIHTEPLLISLPTPDFSMPYNVICLTCTIFALAFGPLHNLSIKRLEIKRRSTSLIKSSIQNLWGKLMKMSSRTVEEKKNL